jgi:hypothetical protein
VEVLKLMLGGTHEKHSLRRGFEAPTQHMLYDGENTRKTFIYNFKVHLNYDRLYLRFIYRFSSHLIRTNQLLYLNTENRGRTLQTGYFAGSIMLIALDDWVRGRLGKCGLWTRHPCEALSEMLRDNNRGNALELSPTVEIS